MQLTTCERRDERFGLVLSPSERAALALLAEQERLSSAAVIRRLIWKAAAQAAGQPAAQHTEVLK